MPTLSGNKKPEPNEEALISTTQSASCEEQILTSDAYDCEMECSPEDEKREWQLSLNL